MLDVLLVLSGGSHLCVGCFAGIGSHLCVGCFIGT